MNHQTWTPEYALYAPTSCRSAGTVSRVSGVGSKLVTACTNRLLLATPASDFGSTRCCLEGRLPLRVEKVTQKP